MKPKQLEAVTYLSRLIFSINGTDFNLYHIVGICLKFQKMMFAILKFRRYVYFTDQGFSANTGT